MGTPEKGGETGPKGARCSQKKGERAEETKDSCLGGGFFKRDVNPQERERKKKNRGPLGENRGEKRFCMKKVLHKKKVLA